MNAPFFFTMSAAAILMAVLAPGYYSVASRTVTSFVRVLLGISVVLGLAAGYEAISHGRATPWLAILFLVGPVIWALFNLVCFFISATQKRI